MGYVSTIVTFHGSTLLARTSDGILVSGARDSTGTVCVFAYMAREDSHVAYLFADLPDGAYPRLEPMEAIGRFLPVGVARSASGEVVSFYSRQTRLFLMATPDSQGALPPPVLLVASERQAFEQLRLVHCEEAEIPAELADGRVLLDQVGTPEPNAASLFRFLMQAPRTLTAKHILNAVGLSLPPRQLRAFADKLVGSPDAAARLQQHFPDDLIASHGLADLLLWLRAREDDVHHSAAEAKVLAQPERGSLNWLQALLSRLPSRRYKEPPHETKSSSCGERTKREIGPELDLLDRLGNDGSFVSLPFASVRYLRDAVRPRSKACIVATARNEGLYLLDWLAYHRTLGFEKFFLYSNDNTDGSDELLDALAEAGEITWINSVVQEKVRPQWKAYNHALQILPEILDYEWSLFIDLDEYFNINHDLFAGIHDYLSWCGTGSVDAFVFNWVMIGSNGQAKWRDEPVRKRFPIGHKIADQHVKSMFRPQRFQASFPHHPIARQGEDFIFRTASMRPHIFHNDIGPALSLKPECDVAWVSHYFTKSYEEFILKFARGRGDSLERAGLVFPGLEPDLLRWVVTDAAALPVTADPHPLDNKVNDYLEHLFSRSAVRSAHERIKQKYGRRAEAALHAAEDHPLFATAEAEGRPLLEAISQCANSVV